MERGLPVEQHDVAIPHMSFHNVPNLQVARYGITIAVVQRLLVPATDRTDSVAQLAAQFGEHLACVVDSCMQHSALDAAGCAIQSMLHAVEMAMEGEGAFGRLLLVAKASEGVGDMIPLAFCWKKKCCST